MIPKMDIALNDFSSGQLNEDAKRSNDPLVLAGARIMSNWRILNSRKIENRPGRRALFPSGTRTEDVLISANTTFRLCFGEGTLIIRDSTGAYVIGNSGYAWTAATVKSIVWTLVNRSATDRDLIICYPGQRPKIARWSATMGWTFLDFAFGTNSYGAYQEPFYRLAPPGATLTPDGTSGSITLDTSVDWFTPGMTGTVIRWIGHQILLTGYTDAQHMVGTVVEQLPDTINLGTLTGVKGTFNIGDAISSTTAASSTFEGEVASVTVMAGVVTQMTVNMFTTGQQFATSDIIVGPNGRCVAGTVSIVAPGPSLQWDEEAFNQNRGWPGSVFFDQNRLGFCDIPAVPGGIVWSRIGIYTDFLVGANPSDPMFEIAPDRSHVYHVVNKSDEFVITDKGIWYIPISASNPLKPGSVQFLKVSKDGCSPVKPVETTEGLLLLNAGLSRVIAVIPRSNSLYVPWGTIETSLYHSDLFNSPVAIATTTGDSEFQERYVYVVNADGTMAVGKFDITKEWIGWLPWSGAGSLTWASSLGADLVMTTSYQSSGSLVSIAEMLDESEYVDGSISVNDPPAAMHAGTDPTMPALLTGRGLSNLTDFAAPTAAFDGNPLKNKAGSVGVASATAGYGNRVLLQLLSGAKILSRLRVTAPLDSPLSGNGSTTFRIVGSHDSITFDTLYTSAATVGTNGEQIDVTSGIAHTTPYEFYGVDVFGTASKNVSVCLIEPFYLAPGAVHKAPNGGTGPMWWLAAGQATLLVDYQSFGFRDIDASGNIVSVEGDEGLPADGMSIGIEWTAILEPFIPHSQPGQDAQQRMRRRRVAKALVSVQKSNGFVFDGRRVPAYNVGDNAALPAPLRENSYQFRPRGRTYDPRKQLVKDTPGPLTVVEVGLEVTI